MTPNTVLETIQPKKYTPKLRKIISFINESKEQLANSYIKNIMQFVKEKQKKRNKNKSKEQLLQETKAFKKHFAELLIKRIHQKTLYLHKGNDIDKSATKFLLQNIIGISDKKIFHEIDHHQAKNIEEGILFDI